ncbi:MAG: thiol reductant ABC exporter subunit CydC [Oscillospiraceae bacterium]|nr:thiol reductant ABC exporter subunit CydC [Oscillospiraceae bacterium]
MRRNGLKIMLGLLGLVKPLAHVMLLCVAMGTVGYLCAIAITVLAADLLLVSMQVSPWGLSFAAGAGVMGACAVLRAVLRYGEQTCGHYIAFKLLAIIRDRVFGALRRLAPAKLEGRGRGDLISLVTGDIELLEVFYAHTIAPVCIAVLVSVLMTLLIGSFHPLLGLLAAVSYLLVGAVIPLASSRMGREQGVAARSRLGALSSYYLESLRGLRETLQYGRDAERAEAISQKTGELNALQGEIKRHEGAASAWSGAAVMALTLVMLGSGMALGANFPALVLSTVMLSASFGPVLALANLSAAMDQTLAAGERVLSLLEEMPETEEILDGESPDFTGAEVRNLSFSYGQEEILHDLSARFPKGEIIAVTGRSGSGKSTLLKLLMRFWNAGYGDVLISGTDVSHVKTSHLRSLESYMTQDTDLFHDSVGDNIRLAKPDATQEEVENAAKKASLHDFILTLPKGYDTPVGELGETLSGGERQRIGLARAFLHGAPLLLLDEPTSNLDSLNEGVILKALDEERKGRTVILVSHRRSTLTIADRAYTVERGRLS